MNELFTKLWRFSHSGPWLPLHENQVTATLAKDADAVDQTIKAGTKVRLVMVSRFGDVGITDKMDSVNYIARVGNERNPGSLETWFNNIEGLTNAT